MSAYVQFCLMGDVSKASARQAVMEKLTPADRALLGLPMDLTQKEDHAPRLVSAGGGK